MDLKNQNEVVIQLFNDIKNMYDLDFAITDSYKYGFCRRCVKRAIASKYNETARGICIAYDSKLEYTKNKNGALLLTAIDALNLNDADVEDITEYLNVGLKNKYLCMT